ncbi:MAG: hypothetical protein CYPHOPRED_002538 [Cyphobasidiales sp. Tagirdzhanova-0007]|nr:MAG: hypothetical protein CYPHOPRED_002538 [Cyphobasidiales sp. Tagirdzhanova-0007]
MTTQTPIHCHTNASGAVKSSPIKMKKEGHGSKGSWGTSADDIREGREILDNGDLPPVSSPERGKTTRKLSVSSGSTTSIHSSLDTPADGTAQGVNSEIILEESNDSEKPIFDEPTAMQTERAPAATNAGPI